MPRGYPKAAIVRASRHKAERRARAKSQRERFFTRHALWVIRRMAIATVEREWRARLITGPDTRDLTGRVLGDPRFERSALYAKQQGWI